ncbi:uncharacterized protein si:dkey-148h10.5 isoform X1 [Anguilla anguilla]|uniref:uncharacterized protein si:dkey-148h10.5 isoform X1 n=1 Tax=Anguilla anguilla TaxID=7936 RepID=UPI0015AEB029|nr:uncharacterized protein si:dkey-148h10.5 isoform X1 [Anguilla anguilla]
MPVKRALHLEEKENQTPSKRPVPEGTYSPLTGTGFLSPAPSPKGHFKARGKTDNPSKTQKPQTDAEKLQALRSQIERSVKGFEKARQQLEKIVPTEGSSELKIFFSRGSADLQSELRRNRELVAQVEAHLKGSGACSHPF